MHALPLMMSFVLELLAFSFTPRRCLRLALPCWKYASVEIKQGGRAKKSSQELRYKYARAWFTFTCTTPHNTTHLMIAQLQQLVQCVRPACMLSCIEQKSETYLSLTSSYTTPPRT